MSEKIFAWLLRLYPSRFRQAYGDEALQLFRDRARDEQGLFPRLRLWLDLLTDSAVSIPREHYSSQTPLIEAPARQPSDGSLSFHVVGSETPGLGALLLGGVFSLVVLGTCSVLISHVRNSPSKGASLVQPRANQDFSSPSRGPASNGAKAAIAESGYPPANGLRSRIYDKFAGNPQSKLQTLDNPGSSQPQASQPSSTDTSAMMAAAPENVDPEERRRVIDRAVANLKQYYFDREVGKKTADAMLAHERNGDDKAATQGAAFAALLTAQMRDASHDMHLVMDYSQDPLPAGPPVQTAEGMARFRERMLQQHCMIRKAEILAHDIGYLKLDFFPEINVCGAEVKAAMASLNHAGAIIFDLRDNSGGFPDTVALVASYLFDHPEYMYGPRGAPTVDSWTRSPVAGNLLADKPVYVLTSGSTWSGAEQFSYDLKMLKRATLVGETTRGGTHAGTFHRIDDHFGMGIPEERFINPYGEADWEGVGVQPDVKVRAADAPETAERLVEMKLQKK
jgi:retinol-binding protein 3